MLSVFSWVNILLLLIYLGCRPVILLAGEICKFYAGKNRRINIGYWHTFRINRREFDLFVYKSEEPLKILKAAPFLIEIQICQFVIFFYPACNPVPLSYSYIALNVF